MTAQSQRWQREGLTTCRSEPASWLRGRATDRRPLCFPFRGAGRGPRGAGLPFPFLYHPGDVRNFLSGGKHHCTRLEKG